MCITRSVGRGGVNGFHDAKTIQILVNLNIYQLSSLAPRAESGVCGASTIVAIEVFQSKVRNMARPDGKADPHGRDFGGIASGFAAGAHGKETPGHLHSRDVGKNHALFPWAGR